MRRQPGNPPSDVVKMHYQDWQHRCVKHGDTAFTASTAFHCDCGICVDRRASPLWKLLTSKLACDPAIRYEVVEHYLNLVDFYWSRKSPRFEKRPNLLQTLPTFMEVFKRFGLRDTTHPIKHLILRFDWEPSNPWFDDDEEEVFQEERRSRHGQLWEIVPVLGVLREYRFKGSLCFKATSQPRKEFLEYLVNMCETCAYPRSFWVEDAGDESYDTIIADTTANRLAQAGMYLILSCVVFFI
jgi:hypothetical protein